ncbi:NTP transferase domain-containing protein [Sphingomonas sp. KRR8]|uniref:molybdenum cofactor guanylyltransferase n=1 Tax=Sphingomonas sp. KRR8 TaxID=2942996 RepID=UPI002020DFE7|nr:NTP transferase domain-containing protein [Sphingomonas sp. KRR8]URD59800.1 NTP transferase domain-containing protein [Sphingomonas sp. KRR8]
MAPLIVVLAGGEGRRMGGEKPLRLLGGETLVDRALRRARHWSDEVRLALRTPEQVPNPGVPILLDDPDVWGPLAGLANALREARRTGRTHVLTLPCDVPFLPDDLLSRLQAAIGDEAVAMAESDGQLHPVCALWSVGVLDRLASYRAAGRRSLKGLAQDAGMVLVDWPEEAFVNVNTPADLAEAERRLRSEV